MSHRLSRNNNKAIIRQQWHKNGRQVQFAYSIVQPSMPAQLAVNIANFQLFNHRTGFMKGQTIKRDQTLTAIVQVNSPQGQIQQRNCKRPRGTSQNIYRTQSAC